MRHRTKLLMTSVGVVAAVSLIVGAVTIVTLYRVSLKQREADLVYMVRSLARLMEAEARVDLAANDNDPLKATPISLRQFVDAHERIEGIGETGEFTLARREGDQIVFLLRHRHAHLDEPQSVAWDSELAEPMRRALSGQSGTVVGLDYRGEMVVAAHEPVAGVNWGIVAKMDLAEIRRPFLWASMLTAAAAMVIVLIGTIILVRVSNPLIDRLREVEESERESQRQLLLQERALASTRDGILITDPNQADNPIVYCNAGFEILTGYTHDEILGRNCRFLQGTDHDQPALEDVRAALREQRECRVTLRNYKKDGEPFWNELTISPVRDAGDKVTHFVGIVRDVTRRKEAEDQLLLARDELERRVAERTSELESSLLALRTSEEQVRNSRDFADTVINSLPGVFYVFDMEGGFLRWNENVEKLTGYNAGELAHMTPLDFFREEDRPMIAQRVQEVFEKGTSTAHADYLFKDGSSAPFLFTGIRFDLDGRQLLIGIGIDVSEQHAAETKLRQHAKRLEVIGDIMESVLEARSTAQLAQAVLGRLGDLIPCARSSIVLFDGQLESATLLAVQGAPGTLMKPGMEIPIEALGDVVSLRQGNIYRIDDLGREVTRSAIQQTLFDEGVRAYACVPLLAEGDLVGTLNIAAGVPNLFSEEHRMIAAEVAKPLAVGIRQSQLHAQVLDHAVKLESRVDERTAELTEAEARFRMVVEAMPNALIMSDSNGSILLANAQAESLFGYSREELVGQPVEMLLPENRRANHPAHRLGYVANPKARAMGAGRDLTAQRKDGREVPVEIGLNPLTIDGQTYVLASIVDITERTKSEDALRESEARFRELFENANDLIQAVSPEGRFVYVNPAWCRTMGYNEDELKSLTVFDVIHPDSLDHCMTLFQQIMSSKDVGTIEATFSAKDGTQIMLEGHASCQVDENGTPVVTRGIFHDVTQREQAAAVLREGVALGQLQYDINVALASRGSVRDVLQACTQAIVDHLDAAFARIWTLNEPERMLELQASAGMYTHLDGLHGRVPVGKFKIGLIAEERKPHLTNAVVGDARVSDQEWARQEGMVAFAGYPLVVDDRVIGVMAMFARRQLTETTLRAMDSIAQGVALGIERLRAEEGLRAALYDLAARTGQLEVAKEQAESADRMKSTFLATMSHELRTPLNSIIGFTSIIAKGLAGPLTDEQEKQLGMVQKSARHLLALINDILDISKIEAGQLDVAKEPFDLRESIDKAASLVRPHAEQKQLALIVEIDNEVGQAIGDQRRVEQVLLNLLNNAIKFSEQGGVNLSARLVRDIVEITVSDTGIGIAAEDFDRLFTPFEQLDGGSDRRHEGTGLGLAICRRLARMMGGDIRVESELGKGSRFMFDLPVKNM